ncbi:MAG TPA: hypothetical protein VNE62_07915 [Actinomycetota bacterium]|nr:hypothetical protein [Actinomycetota bacterium]
MAMSLFGAACGSSGDKSEESAGEAPEASGHSDSKDAGTAEGLHVRLTQLLGEHVTLASFATGSALGGNTKAFEAAAAELGNNTSDLTDAVGSVYPKGKDPFKGLWQSHIDMFVRYTQATAKGDKAAQGVEVTKLTQYANDVGVFFSGANPNLPKDAVTALVKDHVLDLKGVVDAQAAKDFTGAYTKIRDGYHHMDMIGGALAGAIAKQFPTKFSGAADSKKAALHTTLTQQFGEHVALAAAATGNALAGDTKAASAAAAALNGNTDDLTNSVASVYPQAKTPFKGLWQSHIDMFVRYAGAKGSGDQAAQDKEVQNLTKYTVDVGAFFAGANPNLNKDTLAAGVKEHVLGLKEAVDALAAKDYPKAFSSLREAYLHMDGLGAALSAAIAKQFPDKFPA